MPTDKSRYHRNFNKRSDKVTEQPCRICNVPSGGWFITITGRLDRVAIQAHHPNHDPQNGKAKLIPLCEQCHLKIDKWYRGKRISYTLKGKKYEKMREQGQIEIKLKFSAKGKEIDLTSSLLIVDNDWLTDRLISYLKAELSKPKKATGRPETEQLSMFTETEEGNELLPCIRIDFSIAPFMETVSLKNDDISTC